MAKTAIPARADLKKLTDYINRYHDYFHGSLRTTLRYAMQIGHDLLRAKRELGHGEFTTWIRENCSFSPSTARAYMRLVKDGAILTPPNDPKQQSTDDLTLAAALERLTKCPRKPGGAGEGPAAKSAPANEKAAVSGHAGANKAAQGPARASKDAGLGRGDRSGRKRQRQIQRFLREGGLIAILEGQVELDDSRRVDPGRFRVGRRHSAVLDLREAERDVLFQRLGRHQFVLQPTRPERTRSAAQRGQSRLIPRGSLPAPDR